MFFEEVVIGFCVELLRGYAGCKSVFVFLFEQNFDGLLTLIDQWVPLKIFTISISKNYSLITSK
jgi:hypothetical protein